MQIFKNKWFDKYAKKEHISDAQLLDLVKELESDAINVDYGGNVVKQRLARAGQGKSGGYRCIILFCVNKKTFFVYGFAKSERDNITKDDEKVFKDLAKKCLVSAMKK